jgi:hypothetical protein
MLMVCHNLSMIAAHYGNATPLSNEEYYQELLGRNGKNWLQFGAYYYKSKALQPF